MCIRAPPISSSVTRSPITISAIRGEPRYIDALPSRMMTTSQNAGMYAPPAALGPNSTHTCGTTPDIRTWLKKIRPAPRRPGNICTCWSMRAPGRVDEVDQRHAEAHRPLLDPQDLLDGPRRPRAGLDRRIVGHHRHRPPAERPQAGEDALGPQPRRLGPRQQAVLDEGIGIEQPRDPLANRQLALLGGFLAVAFRSAGERALGRGGQRRRGIPAADLELAHAQLTGPAVRTWLPSGRPSTACAARAASSSAGRSTPVCDAHLVEHRHQVLGGDVAGGAGRHRTATELAEARFEALDSALQGREHVRQPLTARVVEVGGELRRGLRIARAPR